MKYKCIIVDDEPLAIEVIENHLRNFSEFEVVGKFGNAVKAFEYIKVNNVDLMFLDIQMPYLTGIEFLRTLKNPPAVIITTAYRDYAIEGFELDVLDYLLKPISLDRFMKAVNKFLEYYPDSFTTAESSSERKTSYILVKADKKNHRIALDEIVYIKSLKDYIQVITENRKITTKIPISKIEQELPDQDFLRIHKSFIVALNKIDSFTSETIDIGGRELPIGRSYRKTVNEIITGT